MWIRRDKVVVSTSFRAFRHAGTIEVFAWILCLQEVVIRTPLIRALSAQSWDLRPRLFQPRRRIEFGPLFPQLEREMVAL